MRTSIAVIVLLFFVIPAQAAEAPVVIFRLTSVHAALDDMEALGVFDDPLVEREQFLREIVEPLNLPLGDWLDRNRPVLLVASASGMTGAATEAVVALLPVLDVGDALLTLGGDAENEPEDGVHELVRADDKHWYVRAEDDYLTVGMQREPVVGFERDLLQSLDFPPGNIGVEVNMAIVTPMVQSLLTMQRQMMKQQMQQPQADAGDQGAPSDPEQQAPSPQAVMEMTDFYFDRALMILRNTARFQLSLDKVGEGAVFRARVVPTPDSELEALLAEQPVGFSKLSRAVPAQPALVSYAANYELTDGFRDGLSQFMDQYAKFAEQMAGLVPGTEWMAEMVSGQQEMARQRLACVGGDAAGIWDMGGEGGFRAIQLSGIPTSADCSGLVEREIESMGELLGPDGEPLVTVSEPNVAPGEVRAMRIEVDLDRIVQGDEAATRLMDSMLGGRGAVSYYGQTETATITVAGPEAEETFAAVVDRLQSRRKQGGLTEETFAPLRAGAGFFAAIDLSRFDMDGLLAAAMPGADPREQDEADREEEEDDEPLTGRIVFGAHAEHGSLALDLALPAPILRSWLRDDTEDGPPPDLWPPPPAPVAVPEEASSVDAEAQDEPDAEKILLAGTDDVTLPVLALKIAPDYPEIMRSSRLEGRIILQAVVSKEGLVRDLEVLNCQGKSPEEAEPRKNLLLESKFCTTFSDAAMAAVERWRYEPARKGDEPVDVYFTVRVDFELQ